MSNISLALEDITTIYLPFFHLGQALRELKEKTEMIEVNGP